MCFFLIQRPSFIGDWLLHYQWEIFWRVKLHTALQRYFWNTQLMSMIISHVFSPLNQDSTTIFSYVSKFSSTGSGIFSISVENGKKELSKSGLSISFWMLLMYFWQGIRKNIRVNQSYPFFDMSEVLTFKQISYCQ